MIGQDNKREITEANMANTIISSESRKIYDIIAPPVKITFLFVGQRKILESTS